MSIITTNTTELRQIVREETRGVVREETRGIVREEIKDFFVQEGREIVRGIVREEVQDIVPRIVHDMTDEKFNQIYNDIEKLRKDVDESFTRNLGLMREYFDDEFQKIREVFAISQDDTKRNLQELREEDAHIRLNQDRDTLDIAEVKDDYEKTKVLVGKLDKRVSILEKKYEYA